MFPQTSAERDASSGPIPSGLVSPRARCWIISESQNKPLDHRTARPLRTDRLGTEPRATFEVCCCQFGRFGPCFSNATGVCGSLFSGFTQVLHGLNMAGTMGEAAAIESLSRERREPNRLSLTVPTVSFTTVVTRGPKPQGRAPSWGGMTGHVGFQAGQEVVRRKTLRWKLGHDQEK